MYVDARSCTVQFNAHVHLHVMGSSLYPPQITSALASLSTVGSVTVWPSTSLPPGDKLGKWCSGRTWYIRFENNPGDLPLVTVNTSNLTGDGVRVVVREV